MATAAPKVLSLTTVEDDQVDVDQDAVFEALDDDEIVTEFRERGLIGKLRDDDIREEYRSRAMLGDLSDLVRERDVRDLASAIARGDTREAMAALERTVGGDPDVSNWVQLERFSARNRKAA